ncbi:hypothetical protein ACSAZL_16915 [Methanosarcina sp. T3]|uniref:hypothetical protein n=1 Tax=Methanosarcina sp. T3 TaxID=3439062 RepID=UPI003F82E7E6
MVAFSGVALAGQSNSLIGELKQVDAFHPPADDNLMPLYNEWHYFNIIDEEQNLSIICVFKLNGCLSASEILLEYNTDNGNSNAYYKVYPIDIAEYSSETPDVTIASNTVKLTPQGYSVHIISEDGSKVFDALFKPEVEPSPVFSAADFSPVYGGVINWIVTSPKMKVNGELTVDGKMYTLKNARGYHDHNWGYWSWGDNLGWDWGQTTQTKNSLNGSDLGKYSLNFGNITDASFTQSFSSVLRLWRNREIIATFSDADMQVIHSNFVGGPVPVPYLGAYMPPDSFPLPLDTDILASSDSGDYLTIKFTTESVHCVPLLVAVPMTDSNGSPLTDEYGNIIIKYRIIWEMIGTYQVDGEIDGKPISYIADGFMEYVSGEPATPISFP